MSNNNYKNLNAAAHISFIRSMLLCTETGQIVESEVLYIVRF